ncbi:reverse transcriptase domain-containing protein, partial [Tanacetum coccineum]
MKQNGVSYDALHLFLFPYSLTHHATTWFDRLPKNSIHTFKEMVSKFHSTYFPPSMVTKLMNDISNFRQLPDESLFKAWERYKLSIDRCPNHNMLPIICDPKSVMIIENMTAHHNDWDTSAQRGKSSRSTTSSSPEIAALSQQVIEMSKNLLKMCQSNQQVNMVNPSCETCGSPHQYFKCQAAGFYAQRDVYAATGNYNAGGNSYQPQANQMTKMEKALNERPQGGLPSNTVSNPQEDVKVITTQSGITLAGPSVPPSNPPPSSKEVERDPKPTMDQPAIPYPSSFAKALAQMPKYAKMLKDLLSIKEKLLELANTPLNENCLAVLLKKLPEKLRDPRKFLIQCDFSELEECMALADL